jgi:hypothetical protein
LSDVFEMNRRRNWGYGNRFFAYEQNASKWL